MKGSHLGELLGGFFSPKGPMWGARSTVRNDWGLGGTAREGWQRSSSAGSMGMAGEMHGLDAWRMLGAAPFSLLLSTGNTSGEWDLHCMKIGLAGKGRGRGLLPPLLQKAGA